MPPVALSARMIDALKPKTSRYAVYDEDCPGLLLRVAPSGGKTWSVIYRHGKRQRRLTLGTYPGLSLAEARTRARRARVQVDDGQDPGAEKQAARAAAAVDTFGALAELYLERHAKKRKRSWEEDARILRRDLLPVWRHTPVRSLTRRAIREVLDEVSEVQFDQVLPSRLMAKNSVIMTDGQGDTSLKSKEARAELRGVDTLKNGSTLRLSIQLRIQKRGLYSEIALKVERQPRNTLAHRILSGFNLSHDEDALILFLVPCLGVQGRIGLHDRF